MSHTHTRQRYHRFSALFCLLLLLSACGQLSENGPSPTSRPAQTTTSSTTSTPGQAQTCPAQASARSALMPPCSQATIQLLCMLLTKGIPASCSATMPRLARDRPFCRPSQAKRSRRRMFRQMGSGFCFDRFCKVK